MDPRWLLYSQLGSAGLVGGFGGGGFGGGFGGFGASGGFNSWGGYGGGYSSWDYNDYYVDGYTHEYEIQLAYEAGAITQAQYNDAMCYLPSRGYPGRRSRQRMFIGPYADPQAMMMFAGSMPGLGGMGGFMPGRRGLLGGGLGRGLGAGLGLPRGRDLLQITI